MTKVIMANINITDLILPQTENQCYSKCADGNRKRHILVAENNGLERSILRRRLVDANYACTMVEDGEDALDLLVDQNFDAMITELTLPSLGGLDMIKAYQFMARPADMVPIIVVSADASRRTREQCLSTGAAAFFEKPLPVRALLAALERFLRNATIEAVIIKAQDEAEEGSSKAEEGSKNDMALDLRILAELEKETADRPFIEGIITSYISDGQRQVTLLEKNLREGRLEEFRFVLHGLRGASLSVGATTLAAYCSMLERMNYLDLKQAEPEVLAVVHGLFKRVCDSLDELRSGRQ